MKSIFRGKTWIILLALASLAGLIVLASSLSELEFDQPTLVALDQFLDRSNPSLKNEIVNAAWFRYVVIGLLVIAFLLFLGPIRPQTVKDLIRLILRFAISMFVVMLFLSRVNVVSPLFTGAEQNAQAQSAAGEATPLPFSPPDINSQWEFWITSAIVVTLGVVAVVVFNRLIDRWLAPKKDLKKIAEIARATLSELSNTKESKNAIIRCYARMNKAVDEHRKLRRDAAMTPSEFADELEKAGLPREAVLNLTHVFERVRYGGQSAGAEDVKEAKQCLTSILKACEAQA